MAINSRITDITMISIGLGKRSIFIAAGCIQDAAAFNNYVKLFLHYVVCSWPLNMRAAAIEF